MAVIDRPVELESLFDMDRRLWLIDAGYLFNARHSVSQGFAFDYLRLRRKLEELGEIWRAYYLNSADRSNDR